jgi:hypothetical protein
MPFIQIILPVFLIILSGFALEKLGRLDFRTLTYCSLYLFSPCLVFATLMKRPVHFNLAIDLFVFMLFYTAGLLAVAVVVGRLLKMEKDAQGALSLTTVMMNVGNFGLPLAYFAFGQEGLDVSVLTFIIFNIPLSTLAIIIAQGSRVPLRQALANTCKIPIFHAVILAFLLKGAGIVIPVFLLNPIDLLGQAAVPLMLVLLGMQLARTRLLVQPGFLSLAAGIRLILAPLVAWGLAGLFDLNGMTRNVVILQTSTPSAVLPLLYSLRFGTRPDLVASAIFVTTLLSAVSLTVLLYLLQ